MNFVTGATGLVGSYLCRYLIKKGEPVIALKRKTSKLDLLADVATKINWIEGDLLDIDLLLEATKGCKRLYHCAALVSYQKKMHQQLIDVNITGTKNIVNAALFNNVTKIVHVSSIAALGTNIKQNLINEKQNADNWNSAYGLSKHLAELEIFRGIVEGIDSVIINPSVILGAGYWAKNSGKLFVQADNNFRYYSSGSTGYVDVRDVVSIMYQLMHTNVKNNRFIVSAQNLTFKNVLTDIAILLNKKPPNILAGSFLQNIALFADYFKSLFSKHERFLSRELIKTAYTTKQYDNTKIKTALPVNFIPIKKSLNEIAIAYKQSKAENTTFGILPLVSNI